MTMIRLFRDRVIFSFIGGPVRDWRKNAANLAEFETWDRKWKRRYGWRGGLRFFSKTNTPGRWVIVSRHWPHLLCWSWSVSAGFCRRPSYDSPRRFVLSIDRRSGHVELRLFWPFISVHWQRSEHMIGMNHRKDGPAIIWNHHRADDEGDR